MNKIRIVNINDIIKKSQNDYTLSKNDLINLLSLPPDSVESYLIMAEANRLSKQLADNKAEVHAQFALNLSPCAGSCRFCSFAAINKVFDEEIHISMEEAVSMACQFEKDGANAIFLMTTADYSFDRFIEISHEIRQNLKPETIMIANVGDKNLNEALKLKDAGFTGVYHALRLREGIDTNLDPENRKESIHAFKEAGLEVGTCVEPVGPEHTNEELAELILFTRSFDPSYSGAARRISIPGSELEKYGMISELRMAQIVAVTRLGMPRTVRGNCTHEPCTLGAFAGANLFWAEVGANPRDTKERTEEGRGGTVAHCKQIFAETDWKVLEGPSAFYSSV